MRLTIALGALLLAGLLVVLASCGPGWPPSVTPEPLTEVAQPQTTPSSTAGPIVSLFQSPIQTPTPIPTPWIEPPPPTRRPTPTIPPVPTRLPTPVVTRIPTAVPPIIPLPPGEPEPYTIVYREGSVVRAVDSDGRNDRVVIDIPAQLSRFLVDRSFLVGTWASPAPDGSRLALVVSDFEFRDPALRVRKQPKFDIYLFNLQTGQLRLLVEDGVEPLWAPNDARIAYRSTRTQGLWVMDIETGHTEEPFPVDFLGTGHYASSFTWAPDGQRLAVVKAWGDIANSGGLWVVSAAAGEQVTQLTPMEMNVVEPNWSPTGSQILFLSSVGENVVPGSPINLWVVDVENGERRQLTRNISVYGGKPFWTSDGSWIVFSGAHLLESETSTTDLWVIANDGSDLRRVTSDPTTKLDPLLLPDGNRIVFLKRSAGLWEIKLNDGSAKQVYLRDISYAIIIRGHLSPPKQ